ncbi:MAG: M20/M25/M40 family metallo-hydrolase, partial [Pseudomonadota bacterium]
MRSIEILDRLIAFPTVSRDSNLELVDYVQTLLSEAGVESALTYDATGKKANLYATIGPRDRAGVMLSGHTDVVPVDGQAWTRDPFRMTEEAGRLYGRGATDMKGFVACALAAAEAATRRELSTPLHLALSYDEEIGCVGVHGLIDALEIAPIKPALAIVGEPTSLAVANGHKGKAGFRTVCKGREGHSA